VYHVTEDDQGNPVLRTDASITGSLYVQKIRWHTYRKLAEAGSLSALGSLRDQLDEAGERHGDFAVVDFDAPTLVYLEDNKSGDAPVLFDMQAQAAIEHQVGLLARRENLGSIVFAGEDVKNVVRTLQRDQLVCRCDSVDGSTLVDNTWVGAASVVTIEKCYGKWLRLEAVSITSMTGMTISMENHTPSKDGGRNRDQIRAPKLDAPRGEVYFADHISQKRVEINRLRTNRKAGSLAAVGYSPERHERLLPYLKSAWRIVDKSNKRTGRYLNSAGNPIVFGLALGTLEAVLEPEHTSLHDSVFLALHEILGGHVVNFDTLEPMNYLEMYQAEAMDLDGSHKLIPPYIAYTGDKIPEWIRRVHEDRDSASARP